MAVVRPWEMMHDGGKEVCVCVCVYVCVWEEGGVNFVLRRFSFLILGVCRVCHNIRRVVRGRCAFVFKVDGTSTNADHSVL